MWQHVQHTIKAPALNQLLHFYAGEAMGLSFSVPRGTRVPPSLVNIYKELTADLGCAIPKHGCLEKVAGAEKSGADSRCVAVISGD